MKRLLFLFAICVCFVGADASWAAPVHFEGFENPAWTAGQSGNWQNYLGGDIQRVTSGTNGITSSSGSAHAEIFNLSTQTDVFGNPSLGAGSPYTQFGGYSSTFSGGFVTSLDVYLDTSWSNGQGFDWSSAVNNQSGAHLRDFIWHVGVVNNSLLVNASSNSDINYNSWKLENENGGTNYTVGSSGWYSLQTEFYDDSGLLVVDFNLLDSTGSEIFSLTRTTSDSISTDVGGNRYGWMVYNNIEGLAVDNTSAVPIPGAVWLLGSGIIGLVGLRRKFKG
jgi:hypothetical protein